MPSIDGEAAAGYSGGSMSGGSVAPVVEAGELCEVLRRAHGVEEILMLDCRGADDYRAGHIRGAVSVGLSSLMLRRLASGKLSLPQVVRHLAADGGDRLARLHQCVPIVLYDHAHASNPLTPTLMTILCRKFNQEGCIAHCLSGKKQDRCVSLSLGRKAEVRNSQCHGLLSLLFPVPPCRGKETTFTPWQ